MKTIVLAYDGSCPAAQAIAYAGRVLAAREALVVYVWAGISHLLLNPRSQDKALRDLALEVDAPDREQAARRGGGATGPGRGIRGAHASRRAARQGVAGHSPGWRGRRRGRRRRRRERKVGLADVILGSNAYGLVNHSPLPTLLVPPATRSDQESGPVLLCYDGSEGARHAIEVAGGLLKNHEARVFSAGSHGQPEPASRGRSAAPLRAWPGSSTRSAKSSRAIWSTPAAELLRRRAFERCLVSVRCEGPVWRGILDRASEQNASLIVVGSRGMSGLSAVLGSVSHGVVHHAKRPVLVVPA